MRRRAFLALTLCALAPPSMAEPLPGQAPPPPSGPLPSDLLGISGDPSFLAWVDDFYGRCLAAGWPRALVDQQLSGLAPDPRIMVHNATQPEFARPISDYIAGAVSPGTVSIGRQKLAGIPQLPKIEQSLGVPREILVAVWGMESGFGAVQGNFDIFRALATLAAQDPRRRTWAETELFACLKIISTGLATRAQLKGSWAGAMGQTQFIPSAYVDTAISASGSGKPDIWNSSADALASAANLLDKGGWRRGEGWAREVLVPEGFDYSVCEGPKNPPAWWAQMGVRRADRRAWSVADAAAEAQLIAPAGAGGPVFLLFPNHFAIRTYNNSLAYALAVGLLADRLAGEAGLVQPWPHETPLSLNDRVDAQTALAKLGYNPGTPDGLVGVGTRQALRAWQKARGLTADGYLSPDMVRRLRAEMASAAPKSEP